VGAGFWTEERVERLKKLVAEGHSFSAINVILGGPSRSAMIGKAHRLKLVTPIKTANGRSALGNIVRRQNAKRDGSMTPFGRGRIIKDGKSQARRIRDALSEGKGIKEVAAAIGVTERHVYSAKQQSLIGAEKNDPSLDIARKQLLDLNSGDCRWPVGDPQKEGFGFCAAPRVPGKPYCKGHLIRAERPIEEQPREIRIAARAERVKEDA
jgi:GcrA cell cycle regulator